MTVENYLNNLPEERIEPMVKTIELIKKIFPNIEETITYKMPTYVLDGETLCAIASQKHYMALYIMPYDLLKKFEGDLKKYNCGKSCIRFKKLEDADYQLFEEIIEYCGENYAESLFYGKMNAKKK